MSISGEGPAARVRLRVVPGNGMAEVFLVDHAFALVDRAVGTLRADVEPGVYKVKARLGDATAERLVVLDGDQVVDMSDELVLASPAPIPGTAQAGDRHAGIARRASRAVAVHAGTGATVMLMARRWSASTTGTDAAADGAPARLSLHRPDGSTITGLTSGDRPAPGRDPALATTVAVDPGAYLVRWETGATGVEAEQVVHAVEGWQTQFFLLLEPDPLLREAGVVGADRCGVSVLMSRGGFATVGHEPRAAEAARSALAGERKVASDLIAGSLFAKFTDPMLGLFGAHLMLVAGEAEQKAGEERDRNLSKPSPAAAVRFHQGLFDTAVRNLTGLLGADHPDVVALATRTTDWAPTGVAPVTVPPMLWRSWLLLLEASQDHPHLVPADTWRRAARPLPPRPFLTWAEAGSAGDDVETEVAQELTRVLRAPSRSREWPHEPHRDGGGPDGSVRTQGRRELSRRLGRRLLVPRAVIDELTAPT